MQLLINLEKEQDSAQVLIKRIQIRINVHIDKDQVSVA